MFEHFVSLGYGCPVASSMSKYGLRSFSCPFDWILTRDFSKVLHYIESDFEGFLQQENLEPYRSEMLYRGTLNPFRDKSSGFVFLHEIEDYIDEFDLLKQKYDRRIKRFNLETQKRTCFLRVLATQEDLYYVSNHAEYIRNVITKNNGDNEIVFFVQDKIAIPAGIPFKIYEGVRYNVDNRRLVRSLFDGIREFLEFCGKNYAGTLMVENLMFDNEAELKSSLLKDRRYHTVASCLSHEFAKDDLPAKTIIYGVGIMGKALYLKIQNLTEVEYFIDDDKGGEFQGVQVRAMKDLKDIGEATIIVSKTYNFDVIRAGVHKKFGEIPVLSLDDLLGLKF